MAETINAQGHLPALPENPVPGDYLNVLNALAAALGFNRVKATILSGLPAESGERIAPLAVWLPGVEVCSAGGSSRDASAAGLTDLEV